MNGFPGLLGDILRAVGRGALRDAVSGDAWLQGYYQSSNRPIFVGGVARSGTTLLSVMLNGHPDLVCGPESSLARDCACDGRIYPNFTRWHTLRGWTGYEHLARGFGVSIWKIRQLRLKSRSRAEFMDRFFAEYARRHGVSRWAEKTPANIKFIDFILSRFPKAYFVHIIRDGRDVACSLRDWSLRVAKPGLSGISSCAQVWSEWIDMGMCWRHHPRYVEIRYEELVHDPEATLRRLFERVELRWDSVVLSPERQLKKNRPDLVLDHVAGARQAVSTESVGRWRRDLGSEDRLHVNRVAGRLLLKLGYVSNDGWVDRGACAPQDAKTFLPRARQVAVA